MSKKQAGKVERQFLIQRTYLKDISLEAPMGADAFLIEKQPEINQDLSTEINQINDTIYEVVLKITATATLEDKTVFLVEVHQAGLFFIQGFEQEELHHVLNTVCLSTLFPYAREVIDSALMKATFPPLMLPPVNFDILYAQALKEQQGQQEH